MGPVLSGRAPATQPVPWQAWHRSSTPGCSVAYGGSPTFGATDFTLHQQRSIRHKRRGPGARPGPPPKSRFSDLPLCDHRRRGLALADLRAAGDAQESKHRGHRYGELLHGDTPFCHDGASLARNLALPSAAKTQLAKSREAAAANEARLADDRRKRNRVERPARRLRPDRRRAGKRTGATSWRRMNPVNWGRYQ
jgi:hypothetical protein